MDANPYSVGSYILTFYDRDGSELCRTTAANWQDGVNTGMACEGDGSFKLLRVVYSSTDTHPAAVRNLEEWEK